MQLLSEAEAKAGIRRKLKSRKWWFFMGTRLAGAVEERFYKGRANADFHVHLYPTKWGLLAFSTAHKRRMSDKQLSDLLLELGVDIAPEQLEHQDVLADVDASDQLYVLDAWLAKTPTALK